VPTTDNATSLAGNNRPWLTRVLWWEVAAETGEEQYKSWYNRACLIHVISQSYHITSHTFTSNTSCYCTKNETVKHIITWRHGLAVACWSWSTHLLYIGPS